MVRINDTNRLTRRELDDIRENSGITGIQYRIVRARFFDAENLSVTAICRRLSLSRSTYLRELNHALEQIKRYHGEK